jgi:hypothetical protein
VLDEAEQLFEAGPANQIIDGAVGQSVNLCPIGLFKFCLGARQNHLRTVAGVCVIGNLRIALGAPVTEVAKSCTGTRADDQTRPGSVDLLCGIGPVGIADRDVPTWRPGPDPQGLGELEQPVHDMTLGARWQMPVAEPELAVARPCAIEAQSDGGAHAQTGKIGALRRVHMQQQRKAPVFNLPAQFEIASPAQRFVEHGEADAFETL